MHRAVHGPQHLPVSSNNSDNSAALDYFNEHSVSILDLFKNYQNGFVKFSGHLAEYQT